MAGGNLRIRNDEFAGQMDLGQEIGQATPGSPRSTFLETAAGLV